MITLEENKEKLSKIEENCRMCHAKMCNICPNNKLKTKLKKEIEKIEGVPQNLSFLEKLKIFLKI